MLEFVGTRTAREWDALKTAKELYEVFDSAYNSNPSAAASMDAELNNDPEMKRYFADKDFEKVAAEIKEAAKPLIPILEKILKHLPEDTAKGPGYETGQYTYKERAEGRLADIVKNESPENVAIYTTLLLVALTEHFPRVLADGMRIPETRAARRAFARYKALKADEQKRRAEFEKTESYRIQVLEMKAGERDHIEYPEE